MLGYVPDARVQRNRTIGNLPYYLCLAAGGCVVIGAIAFAAGIVASGHTSPGGAESASTLSGGAGAAAMSVVGFTVLLWFALMLAIPVTVLIACCFQQWHALGALGVLVALVPSPFYGLFLIAVFVSMFQGAAAVP